MPETETLQRAADAARSAKASLDEAEREFGHAKAVGKPAAMIAFGRLLQAAVVYLAALEAWAAEMGE